MKNFLKITTKINFLFFFFLFIAVVLMATVNAIPGNGTTEGINKIKDDTNSPFQSSLTRGRFALVKSYMDDGTLQIDKYATTTFPDVIYHDGHYYSVFIPGTAFLVMPLYNFGKPLELGVLATNMAGPIAIVLTASVMYFTLRLLKMPLGVSLLSVFLMVFGTQLVTYGTTLNAHYFSALAIAIATYGTVLSLKKKSWIGLPLFWFAFGMGTIVDYPNALSMLPLGIFLFFKSFNVVHLDNRRYVTFNTYFIWSMVTALIFFFPYFLYVHDLFNTYFTTIEPHQINGNIVNGKVNYSLAADPSYYLDKQIQYKTLNLSQQYLPLGFYTSILSPARGLFVFSSYLLVGFFGIFAFRKQGKGFFAAIAAGIGITVLTYSMYADYAGGWAYGPRFLVGITPYLTLFVAYALKKYILNFWFLIAFIITSIASISIAMLGTVTGKLLVSPIENQNWSFTNSFLSNINQIHTEKYVSFFYDQFLRQTITPDTFLCILYGAILVFFVVLTNITVIQSKKEGHVYA